MSVDASSDVLGMTTGTGIGDLGCLHWPGFLFNVLYLYRVAMVGWTGNIYIPICGQGQMVMIYIFFQVEGNLS
jgi:hypothetical protein